MIMDRKKYVATSGLLVLSLSFTTPILCFTGNCFCRRTLPSAKAKALGGYNKKKLSDSALNYRVTSEDEAVTVLLNARDCAYSSSCSLEEAQAYLEAVTHVQLGCATGHPISDDACEDPLFLIELSHELKNKIASINKLSSSQLNSPDVAGVAVKKTKVEDYASAVTLSRILALMYGLFLVYAIGSIPTLMHHADSSTTSFTIEEWGYAIKDGYLPLMATHYIRNGGAFLLGNSYVSQ